MYSVSPVIAACAFSFVIFVTPVTATPPLFEIGYETPQKSLKARVAYLPSYPQGTYVANAYPSPTAYDGRVAPQAAPYTADVYPPPTAYAGSAFTNYQYYRYPNWSLYAPFIQEASQRFGVPSTWIEAVIRFESRGNVYAVSPAGAIGLMQLLPSTWRILRARYGLGYSAFDPHDNIMAGTAYLRELYDRYGSPGFLISYNAGPARWEAYLTTGQLLPASAGQMVAALRPYL